MTDKDFPAFPRQHDKEGHNGMTLRDYFAIHGPEPTRQQVEDYMVGWTNRDTRLARSMLRYLEADAMLKARTA
jgi:hypothetical protein